MSLSNRLAGDDVGELTGVTVSGSFPFLEMEGDTRGGEDDDMKMGRDPLYMSPIGMGEGDRIGGSSVGSGMETGGCEGERG